MGLTSNLLWYDDGGFAYVATCTLCPYISPPCDDEDDTFRAATAVAEQATFEVPE